MTDVLIREEVSRQHIHKGPCEDPEGGRPSASQRGLRRNQHHQQLDLRLPASRNVKECIPIV